MPVTFQKTIIKARVINAEDQRQDHQRQHEIALLHLLIPRYLNKSQEILLKHKNISCKKSEKELNLISR